MNLPTIQESNISMTSLQIAELCNKRHDSVKRTIEILATPTDKRQAVIRLPHSEEVRNEQNQRVLVYIFRGSQGRLDSITIVAQLDPQFTANLVARWDELERQVQQPKELTRMDLIRLAYEAEQERLALEYKVSELQPKADALDVISVASTSLNIRETAKTVGIQEKKFIAWCIKHGWLYRDKKEKLCPVAHRLQKGFLEQKANPYHKPNGEVGISTQAMFTGKALTHLASIFAIVKEVA